MLIAGIGFLSRMSPEQTSQWMKDQIYIALGNLLTVCAVEKIDSCPMEGFISSEYDKVLSLDKYNLKSVVVCPVGFRSENDKYSSAKKVRYSLDELVIKL